MEWTTSNIKIIKIVILKIYFNKNKIEKKNVNSTTLYRYIWKS